jgi:hypothetical protein
METEFSHEPLIEYVRDRHNQKVGVVVACKMEGTDTVVIGHSKANLSRGDKFDKKLGINIAIERAIHGSDVPAPSSLSLMVEKMKARAIKYFKVTPEEVFAP